MNKKINLTILNPGGNITVLVEGTNRSLNERKMINDKIMAKFSEIEQVGFIDYSPTRLVMAGGEFCGNALRCAAFLTLKGKPGKTDISVSGTKQILKSRIDKKSIVWSQMPIFKNRDSVREAGDYLHCGSRRYHPSNYLSAFKN
jgi:diaminopimelate epimerase